MINGLSPQYLSDLVPATIDSSSNYNLRNSNNIRSHSAVGNVSAYRCVCDCRSRDREFDPAWSHTFVEIDHEIISTVILLPSADSFKKGCCQLQAKVCAQITG